MCAGYLVGCGWWGGRRVVGCLVLVCGFLVGVGFLGLGCLVGGGVWLAGPGSWLLGGVVWWGLFPLDPSLTPAPTCLVCCGSWFGLSLCWVVVSVGWWASVGCDSFLGGGLVLWVVCLAGCVLVWLFSTLGRGCCSRWSLRFGRVFVGACLVVAGSVGCVRVGGLFSGLPCCSRWAGRPGRSGSSSPPSLSPHYT